MEKVVSFETGGWENAKKGVYQIKDTFVNFWFKFVYPNMSNLYLLSPEEFYDTYIEKDSSVNDEIDKLRHSATLSLFERKDVIIVASVSCIYGLGDPEDYQELMLSLRPGMQKGRNVIMKKLVEMQYKKRNRF